VGYSERETRGRDSDGTVQLGDGRSLGYAEYGGRGGTALIVLHGVPGGRAYELNRRELVARGVWQFTLELPGFGLSDPHPDGVLLDWPADVTAFADAMRLDRFAVLDSRRGPRTPWRAATPSPTG